MQGASFTDSVRLVQQKLAYDLDEAYELVFRIYRGGGLTKDGLYLSGFLDVVRYWLSGRDLAVLCAGKVSVDNAPIVRDLIARGVLLGPRLLPRFLDDASRTGRHPRGVRALASGRERQRALAQGPPRGSARSQRRSGTTLTSLDQPSPRIVASASG